MIKIQHLDLYEILVPTVRNDGRPIRTRFHRVWDKKVREITGGLSILPPIKGQWTSEDNEVFSERMIPVRIAVNSAYLMVQIAEMTMRYYEQKAIMYYRISDNAVIVSEDNETPLSKS